MTVGAYQPPLTLSPDIATKSPLEKAAYYNTLLGQGYSDAQIRQAAGTQTDTDWSALQGLASGLQPKTPAPPPASSVNALSAAPAASSSFNGMVLNNLYQQMLGRAPDESGFNFWLNAMENQGYTPTMVASEFMRSPEYQSRFSAPASASDSTVATAATSQAPAASGALSTVGSAATSSVGSAVGTGAAADQNAMGTGLTSTQAPATGSPEWFKNYIYAGGANDAEATRRGIDWVTQQGMRPQDAVNLWNRSLGTNFNVTDLFGQTGTGPEMVNFGDANSWTTGAKAFEDKDTGMIRSEGAYFQRGNDAIVSDELFWNPNSPTGSALADKVKKTQAEGQRAGVVVTPYAVFQNKATNEQLLNEIKNSGTDFVALDPYVGWGVPANELYEWTKNFISQVNALGKEVKLVTQGFARKGEEDTVNEYNKKLLALPGVSEVINFGLEDWYPEGSEEAKKLFASNSEWTPLGNDFKRPEKRTIEGTGTTVGETGGLPTAASAAASAVQQAASASPQALFTTLLGADPNIADQLRANYNQAFNQGEGSTFNDPGMQVGEYTLRSMPISYDFAGERQGGGFQATKTATNDRNLPLETTYTYDDGGAITGAEVRYFTGGDSGVVIRFDGQGNKIDEEGFDYSESWKGAVAPLVSMAAMAFAGPMAQSLAATIGGGSATLASNIAANAIVRGGLGAAQAGLTGGDVLRGALTGAATGALGAGGASLANTAAAETLNLTGSQIAADAVRGAVQSGLNAVPGVIASGGDLSDLARAGLVGGITSGAGSAIGSALEGTGITSGQVSAGIRLAQELSSGRPNISAIANAAAGLVNNPNATVAARAIGLVDTIQRAGSNPAALMGIMEAASQLSSAVDRASLPSVMSDKEANAFLTAKRAGASDEEALATARAAVGGDAIDRATARATGLPITQMAIPEIEIFDEEWGDLTQAQKDAANRMTLNIGADKASTPQEAAALARSQGYGMFTFGGNRYTLGASAEQILAQDPNYVPPAATTGAAATTKATGAAKVVPGWGREGNLIQGFNNATVGTTNQARAAEILREVFGDSVDWVDQNAINAAASYVYANREDLLRQDLAQGNVLGIGTRGPTAQDITSVRKDYAVEGARIAGPAEVEGADIGYDANGVPIAVVKTAGATEGKRMTKEERDRYDFEQGLAVARNQTDPFTGQSLAINPVTGKEMTFEDYQASDTLRETIRGLSAPVMKGVGELGQLAGYATGNEALTQAAANLEAQGRSITPEVVRQGTANLINDIDNAEGITGKGAAIVRAVIDRPWQTLAAVGDLAGTELVQEILPFGASFAAGKAVSGAMKAKFGELVSQRAGTIAGVTANATSDAVEAGLQSAQQVYNELRGQGFGHERASEMAMKAGLASAAVETVASVVGEGPLMNSLVKGVPGSVVRTTAREGISEFPAGYLQTAIGDVATNRLGTFDPNAALTGGYLETLAGGPTAGVIQAGGNLNLATQAATGAATTGTTAGTSTAGTTTGTTGTTATGATTGAAQGADATSISNNFVATVQGGADASQAASTSVGSVINNVAASGGDVSQAASTAVGSIINSAASTGADVASVTSSSVSGAVASAVTSGANVSTVTQGAVNSAVASAVTSGLDVNTAVNSAVGGAVTSAATAGGDVAATVNSAVGSAVASAVSNGADVSTAVSSSVSSAVNSAVNSGVDASTAVNSSVASAVNSAVTSAVNTGTNVSTAINTAVNSAVNSAVTSAVNTGTNVSTAVNTAVNSAVTSAISTAVNSGTDVNTAVNTAVNSAVNSAVNTATSTGTNVNTAVTAAVTSAVNAAVNSGVDTSTAVNAAVNAAVSVGVSTSVATQIANQAVTSGGGAPAGTPPGTPPGEPTVASSVQTTPTTTTKTTKPTTPSLPSAAPAMLAAGISGGMEMGRLAPQMLESKVTQGYVDPLAQVRQAQEQFERDAMMQNIDPRLMQILSERMGAPQGGLGQAANEQPYYSYGQEDSIDDIMGGSLPEAVNYAKGGYVEPLQAKEGGMALPLLAKAGGLPTHKGREDFKDGKHVAGEGDGQSDDIPAWLADGEFVFPADVVSALGNGSTKAGTDKLYEMMHNIRKRARSKGPKDLPPPALKSPLDYLKSKR